ncbi:MAG: HD domain-containing protein [Bacteroidales bacterium]|jgi:putative nucleotidyltransferase with HDIG domain|nr:HD domain-containing protein [Bacteroidales bacterium]
MRISKDIVSVYKQWFANYIYQFIDAYPDLKENIGLKADHSKKVSEEMVGLAKHLELDEQEVFLAETIGLFHDIGRFKQYVKFQTFSDDKSQNHAELAIEVFKENNLLKDLSGEEIDIIHQSILNHNKAKMEYDQNEKNNFFSQMIRDADKLDIWRLITGYYMVKNQNAEKENKTLELDLPDYDKISDKVYQSVINRQVVLKESMQTLNDFKLLQIGWVFDLNFNYSVKRLYEKKYLVKIFDALPENEKMNQIRSVVNDFFNTTLNDTSVKNGIH